MKNYKVTNLKNDSVYFLNEKERSSFFLKNCYQDANYNFNYKIEELSDTPIQDRLNKVMHSTLDVVMYFIVAIGLGVITLEVLTNLI